MLGVFPSSVEVHQVRRMFLKVGWAGANAFESQKLAIWARNLEFIRVVGGVM